MLINFAVLCIYYALLELRVSWLTVIHFLTQQMVTVWTVLRIGRSTVQRNRRGLAGLARRRPSPVQYSSVGSNSKQLASSSLIHMPHSIPSLRAPYGITRGICNSAENSLRGTCSASDHKSFARAIQGTAGIPGRRGGQYIGARAALWYHRGELINTGRSRAKYRVRDQVDALDNNRPFDLSLIMSKPKSVRVTFHSFDRLITNRMVGWVDGRYSWTRGMITRK